MVKNNLLKKTIILCFFNVFFLASGYGQNSKKFLIYLKDKDTKTYSIKKPEDFLSKRAIERRKNQGIAITTRDIPVNPFYIKKIKDEGINVWYASKWLNALMIETDDAGLEKIKEFTFVLPKNEFLVAKKTNSGTKEIHEIQKNTPPNSEEKRKPLEINAPEDYGKSFNQAAMLKADEMHKQGYRGQGMIIAVFDAGFENADKLSFFKHLFDNKQIRGTYNFVENHEYVYATGDHGTKVLSTIAAYKKGEIIGTAPEADFYLFRTEDASSEYRVEEVNWLIAAERADSLGVDVINSSLGYNNFDDNSMSYTYSNMDGNTALVTKAADFAAATGILVVNSAGNEGSGPWQYVGAPADADSIIAVGAVDKNSDYAYFSSKGPTSDKRMKPSISAQGLGAVVGSPDDFITTSNGTSFSSPIICGLATAFWQANPTLSNMEVIEILQKSASQADKPDNLLGYGIPDFIKATELAKKKK